MKTLSLAIATLVTLAAFGSAAPGMTGPAAAQQLAQAKQAKVLKLQARNAAEVRSSFGLAARQPGAQAIEISCAPGSSEHCTGDFVAACDKNKGGMSTNPDGSVTCSLPQHE